MTFDTDITAFDCSNVGDNAVTLTVTDANGNSSTCSATVIVEDNIPPVASCQNITIQLDASGAAAIIADDIDAGSDDACGIKSLVASQTDFDCSNVGANTVTLTVTDNNDNVSTCDATVTVEDNVLPVAVCQDISVQLDAYGSVTVSASEIDNGSNDACGISALTLSQTEFGCDDVGDNVVTLTVYDNSNNTSTCTATISVGDTIKPEVISASDLTVECDGNGNTDDYNAWLANHGGATASDICNGGVTWSDNADQQVWIGDDCNKSITVTFSATDVNGNINSSTATFTIEDTSAPTLTIPAEDLSMECYDFSKVEDWLATATAYDTCQGNVTVSNNFSAPQSNCSQTITVTFTATDGCGNTTSATKAISVSDTTSPVLTLPADITVDCDASTDPQNTGSASATDNCDDNPTVTYSDFVTEGECANGSEITRTWTATDVCGNTVSQIQTITVQDTTPPSFDGTLPADITVECDAVPDMETLTATDNCGTATVTMMQDSTEGDCPNEFIISRTWIASDACGNTISHTQVVTLQDTKAPEFNEILPTDITVECDEIPVADTLTAFDNCGEAYVTFEQDSTPGECPVLYTITRTWTAVDACGNSTVHNQVVTVQDTKAPEFNETLPADTTIACGDVPTLHTLTASDICGNAVVTLSQDTSVSENSGELIITRTWTAADDCDNKTTHTQIVTIKGFPVEITDAQNQKVLCTGYAQTVLENWLENNGGATVLEACGDVSWTNDFTGLSDGCGPTGRATVTFTATDEFGNGASTTATFEISDHIRPAITNQASDLTVDCSSDVSAALDEWLANNGGAKAVDACSKVSWVNNFTELTHGKCGAFATVTFNAFDACGNFVSTSATFTVIDTIAPTFTVPADVTLYTDENCEYDAGIEITGEVTDEYDACDTAELEVTYTDEVVQGECAGEQIVLRTWNVTDGCGNATTAVQTISVRDNIAPTLSCNPMTVYTDESGSLTLGNTDIAELYTVSDNCSAEEDITVTVSQYEFGCNDAGMQEGITVVMTATDLCGNVSTCSSAVTVVDTITPIAVCSDLTIALDADGNASITLEDIENGSTDNCSIDTMYIDKTDFNCANVGENEVVLSVVDHAGNIGTCTSTVIVMDTIAPTAVCSDMTVALDTNGNASLTLEDIENGSTDNCSIDTMYIDKTDFTCANVGENEVVLSVVDHDGNIGTCTSTVIVIDTIAPTAVSSDMTIDLDANGNAIITLEDIENGSADNCSIDTMFIDKTDFTCANVGTNEVILTVIDASGNVATDTSIVTVEAGDADCGKVRVLAAPDTLTLVVCPGGIVNGVLNLLANDEGIGTSGVTITADNLPDNVQVSLTDGQVLYANEESSEAVIQFTYTICSNTEGENCSSAEATIYVQLDSDCDGIPDVTDIDDDDDGIPDDVENDNALNQSTLDSDGDGIVDRLDIDSDNDGIVDNIEWQSMIKEGGIYDYVAPTGNDTNGDGWDDAYDSENGGNWYPAWDTDFDDIQDYLDTDTDDDGIDDSVEGWDAAPHDTIADVLPAGIDSDNDGLYDAYDSYNTTDEWLIGLNAIGSFAPLQDMARDTINGIRDWRDDLPPLPKRRISPVELIIPEGFSPNTDNKNDYFEIRMNESDLDNTLFGEEYPDAHLYVYNRWGNLIFEKEHYGNYVKWGSNKADAWWDGRSDNSMTIGSGKVPPATYIYILILDNDNVEKGTLFINY